MATLHICRDHNFVTQSSRLFEEYYPGENIFVIHSVTGKLKIIRDAAGFMVMNLYDRSNHARLLEICRERGVDRIVLHALVDYMPTLLGYLRQNIEFKTYWIFWGYELYETIGYEKGYKLVDEPFSPFRKECYFTPNRVSKFIRKITHNYRPAAFESLFPHIDYFCFWNKSDYDLLRKYYDYPIEFRYFSYGSNRKGQEPTNLAPLDRAESGVILVNHQASLFGNHTTVLKRLDEIDPDHSHDIIAPLSYGSAPIRKSVLKAGRKMFGDRFKPILDYMPAAEYFKIINNVDVAIFGQRRQEASGNIIELLKNGVKVFLRNDNNLLGYYRDKGYIIYSFEDDLADESALRPLSLEEKRHNRKCYLENRTYYDDFMPHLFDDCISQNKHTS